MEKMYNIEWLKTIKKKEVLKYNVATYAISQTDMIANIQYITMEHGTNQQIVTITMRTQ